MKAEIKKIWNEKKAEISQARKEKEGRVTELLAETQRMLSEQYRTPSGELHRQYMWRYLPENAEYKWTVVPKETRSIHQPDSSAGLLEEYQIMGEARGVKIEDALKIFGKAHGGQTIYVERHYMGSLGQIHVLSRDNDTADKCEELCKSSGRWYVLARI